MVKAYAPGPMPSADRAGGWSNRDFHDEVPRRRRLIERGATSAVATLLAFVVFLAAIQHEYKDCGDACYDGGLRTYEPGHGWTAYQGSWQWQGQWALALLALVLGFAAIATSTRMGLTRWTRGLLLATVVCSAAWIAWRVLEPAVPT
jgi:hypothetical protein